MTENIIIGALLIIIFIIIPICYSIAEFIINNRINHGDLHINLPESYKHEPDKFVDMINRLRKTNKGNIYVTYITDKEKENM